MTRVVLVTGSTDGIGRQTARQLAAGGMKVIVHGRSKPKVDATLDELRGELPGAELEGIAFDLGRLSEVRRGAEAILQLAPELHVLVNNAGLFANERAVTVDGIEMTFAVDYVAPFLLTELLAPRLEASASTAGVPSRVINVASVAHTRGKIHLGDLQLQHSFTGYTAYAQAKLAQVMHAITLSEKRDPQLLAAYSVHPGVVGTKLLRQGFGPVQGQSAEQGARALVRLAGGDRLVEPSGTYFSEGTPAQPSPTARDASIRAALWRESASLAGL
jgi:NAD(P)-dependent dehydrogenase (short-subunit alcohol dehydrogenase family)